MRILIVEDEVRLARHISRALTTAGHDVTVSHDGETALREANATRYSLIVLDVMLPSIDGFEVLRRLRKARIDSRVLILTARGELNDRVSGLALGADDYLLLPSAAAMRKRRPSNCRWQTLPSTWSTTSCIAGRAGSSSPHGSSLCFGY